MKKNILQISAFLFGLVLPISTKAGNITIGLLLFCIVYILFIEKIKLSFSDKKQYLFTTLFIYILLIIGVFMTEDKANTINSFGKYCSYLLAPIIIGFLPSKHINEIKKNSFYGLSLGAGITSVFLLANNFIKYFSAKQEFIIDKDLLNYYYTYHEFTKPIGIHPTYVGMYILLALAFLFSQFYSYNLLIKRIGCIVFILILLTTVMFLNSRIILFLATILIFIFLYVLLIKTHKENRFLFYGGIFGLVFLFLSLFNIVKDTYLFSRMTKELKWDLSQQIKSKYNGKTEGDSRVARWNAVLDLIKEKPFFGYGAATEYKVLSHKYLEKGLIISAKNRYDTHNQYLSFALEYGILGLFLFLLFLFGNFYFSFKMQDYIGLYFFFILFCVSLFENVFKLNAGIIFIAFFSNIFLFSHTKIK